MSLVNQPVVHTFVIEPGTPGNHVPWEFQVQDFLDSLPEDRNLFFIGPHPRDNCRVWAVTVRI